MKRILVLGGSSWIGHYVVHAAAEPSVGAEVVSTYAGFRPALPGQMVGLRYGDGLEALGSLIKTVRPTVVMNLWRGESEEAFQAHARITEDAERLGFLYYYFSSASAILGNQGGPHSDAEKPSGLSDYGRFKARCEQLLLDSRARHACLRFACAHGVAENRMSRTVEFLEALSAGHNVDENPHFVQTRILDTELAHAVLQAAINGVEGVIHLGSSACTDEVSFKRDLARAFGYDEEIIRAAPAKPVHAGLIPSASLATLALPSFSDDAGIIRNLVSRPALRRYLRPSTAARG